MVDRRETTDARSFCCHVVRFNQDVSCVAIGTSQGFSIYNLDPIERRFQDSLEGIGKIEMLYCTSLLALVGSGDMPGSSPRRLKLCKGQTKDIICELPFSSSVLSVRMNKQRLLVVLESHIHIYDLAVGVTCLQVLATSPNSDGLVALSREESSIMAFPGNLPGDVVIYDCVALRLLSQISAHKTAVVAMEFNRTGSMLATASRTGTIIRLFLCPSGEHLYSFRRGSRPMHINSLSFCPYSQFLSVGSASGSVHIFSLESKPTVPSIPTDSTATSPSLTTTGADSTASASLSSGGRRVVSSRSSSSYPEKEAGTASRPSWQQVVENGGALLSTSVATLGRGLWMLGGEYLSVLPEPVQEFADSGRAVAIARVPAVASDSTKEFRFCAALAESHVNGVKKLKVVVITFSGILFRFSIPDDVMSKSCAEGSTIGTCVLEDEAFLCED